MAKNSQKKEKALRNKANALKYRKKTTSRRFGPRPGGPGGPGAGAPRPAAAPAAPAAPAAAPAEE